MSGLVKHILFWKLQCQILTFLYFSLDFSLCPGERDCGKVNTNESSLLSLQSFCQKWVYTIETKCVESTSIYLFEGGEILGMWDVECFLSPAENISDTKQNIIRTRWHLLCLMTSEIAPPRQAGAERMGKLAAYIHSNVVLWNSVSSIQSKLGFPKTYLKSVFNPLMVLKLMILNRD